MASNDTGEVSDSTLLDAFRAVIRGFVIPHIATRKKLRRQKLSEIIAQLTALQKQHQEAPSPSLFKNNCNLKFENNNILSWQISTLLLKVKHKQFELGDKPALLLPQQRRGVQASRTIHSIQNHAGSLITFLMGINERFQNYYESLCDRREYLCFYTRFASYTGFKRAKRT